tara:strand:- start:141 stop:1010 length:870 start_codon:yes stop_codon:yes gene_type:complete
MSYPVNEKEMWFDRYMDEPFDVVIDTETTGLGRDSQIVSIGWAFSVKRDYAYMKDGTVEVYSGSFTVRPDMERIAKQEQDDLITALRINGIKLEELENHEIEYQNVWYNLENRIKQMMRMAGLHPTSRMKLRFIAYNRGFDYVQLGRLPDTIELCNSMPRTIFEDTDCDTYQRCGEPASSCLCDSRPGCIMLNHSEWKMEQGWGTRWSKLVDAFNTHFGSISDKPSDKNALQFYWINWDNYEGYYRDEPKKILLDKITSAELQVNAHDAEIDCLMAEIVNYHLKVWRGY